MVHLAKQWNTVPSQLRCEIKGGDENRFELFYFVRCCCWWSITTEKYLSNESFYVKFSRTHKMSAFFTRICTQIWSSIPYSIITLKRSSSFWKKDKGFITNFLWSEDGNSWSTLPYKVVLHVILVPLRNRYLITVFYVSLFYWLYCNVLSLFRPFVVTLHCIYVFPLPPYCCCSCCLGNSFVVAVVDSRIQSFKNSDSKHGKRDYKESKNVE